MALRVFISLIVFVLASCATSGGWKNPNLPPEQARPDEAACRRSAEEDMGPQTYAAPGSDEFDTPMEMVDRSELRDRFATLLADCMERKGYRRPS